MKSSKGCRSTPRRTGNKYERAALESVEIVLGDAGFTCHLEVGKKSHFVVAERGEERHRLPFSVNPRGDEKTVSNWMRQKANQVLHAAH